LQGKIVGPRCSIALPDHRSVTGQSSDHLAVTSFEAGPRRDSPHFFNPLENKLNIYLYYGKKLNKDRRNIKRIVGEMSSEKKICRKTQVNCG
jgi:hypothetical protein